jgi:20S proteasome subunit beta 7
MDELYKSNNDPIQHTQRPIVTGTSVLACKFDGVMMMADTLGAYGGLLRFKSIERITQVNDFTMVGGSGEYSDFQFIQRVLTDLTTDDFCENDNTQMSTTAIYGYLCSLMYQRRSKGNPLWNELVVCGVEDGKTKLGYIDLQGTNFEEDVCATGYGAYLAIPILRKGFKKDLTADQARALLEDAMRVLVYRDCRTINKFQIAKVTGEGVTISQPYSIDTKWNYERFVNPDLA